MQYDVIFGQPHVMRQARARQIDTLEVRQHIVLVDDAVCHPRLVESVVEEREFTRLGVDLAVRRHVTRQLAAETLVADCLERARINTNRLAADVPQRHQRTIVKHEIGVGRILINKFAARSIGREQHAAGIERSGKLRLVIVCANKCVAIFRLAVLEIDRMDHAVAVEPMM